MRASRDGAAGCKQHATVDEVEHDLSTRSNTHRRRSGTALAAGACMTAPRPAEFATPAAVVDEYLRLLMLPDPAAARRFVAPDLRIRFTGGRAMRDPAQCAAFNATRYCWVRKRVERTETVAGGSSIGVLFGEWTDSTLGGAAA
jgi:hypothetical protein